MEAFQGGFAKMRRVVALSTRMAPTLHWTEVVCDNRAALRDNDITDKSTNISKGPSHSCFEKRPPAPEAQREFEN